MKKFLCAGLLLCLMSILSFGQDEVAKLSQSVLENDASVRYGKLENGLTYYLKQNKRPAERAEFYLVTSVGAIQETPAQDGLAHFLEHMCFNGTKNLPDNMLLDYFQSVGAEFGRNINAGTGVEVTFYMLNNIPVTRQGIIDTALLVMHDYSAFVTFDPEEVEKERGVIEEEWRTGNNAQRRLRNASDKYLYKDSKYANCTVIGDVNNILTFDRQELLDLYNDWYRTDLQALIVVGDIDVDIMEQQIIDLFSDIPLTENPKEKEIFPIPDNVEPIVGIVTDPEATSTDVTVYFKSDPIPTEYQKYGFSYADNLVKRLISSMFSERFTDITKEVDAPFFDAYAYFGSLARSKDAFTASFTCQDGKAISGFNALMLELEKAKRYGFTNAEFERAKASILRRLEASRDRAATIESGSIVWDYIGHFLDGTPYMTADYEYEIGSTFLSALSVEMINQAMASLDLEKNMVVIYNSVEKEGLVHPTETEFLETIEAVKNTEMEAPIEENLNVPLVSGKIKGSKVKKEIEGPFGTTEWILKNGTRVVIKPTDHKKDEVNLLIVAQGGTSLIPTEELGVFGTEVTGSLMRNAGAGNFSSSDLDKMTAGKNVYYYPQISSTSHGMGGGCSPKDFETLLQLIYLNYNSPRFVESDFTTVLNQYIALLPNYEANPDYIFSKERTKIIFDNNPRNIELSVKLLENFDLAQFEKNYRLLFDNNKNAVITITGNVNLEEIKPLVEKYLGSLPIEKKPSKAIDRNMDLVKGKLKKDVVLPMETPKTTVFLLYNGNLAYTKENLVKMEALNMMLDLVYTKTIREEEGGTYGVSAYGRMTSEFDKDEFNLYIAFDTSKDKYEKLVTLAKKGIEGIAAEGPTQEMLDKYIQNSLKNISENRINNHYWDRVVRTNIKYGIDIDSEYEAIVSALTIEDIAAFTKEILDQENEIEIILLPEE